MTPHQLRQSYLDFLKERGHAIVPSAPLVPENDPTTLFTGSGMQPMMPYLLGEKHSKGTRIVDSQKCFRSQDIEEVGDNRHTTYFEMLGNWSFGDYFKTEQIEWFYTFLTKHIGLKPQNVYVTVFRGLPSAGIPKDDEAVSIWQSLFAKDGVDAKAIDWAERDGMQGGRIFYYDEKKNWWSRAGVPDNMPLGEPGGPDSEVFYDFGADRQLHENSIFRDEPCHVNCDCGRFLEIGNNVFMTYVKTADGFVPLQQKNIDFGGGLERLLAAVNDDPDVFMTDFFTPIMNYLSSVSGQEYANAPEAVKRSFRVIADHMRAAVMLAADGVYPSNKEQGYFARRLVRRSVRYGQMIGINKQFIAELVPVITLIYAEPYPDVSEQADRIVQALSDEEKKFLRTLEKGLREFEKIVTAEQAKKEKTTKEFLFTPELAFTLYETYGFPVELSLEEAKQKSLAVEPAEDSAFMTEFDSRKQDHAIASRTASAGKFKGGLQDHSETTIKYHTATHLLHAALRKILGTHVQQKGSNITVERLRFDFSHPAALTEDEKKAVEQLINDWIKADLPVTKQVLQKQVALDQGAIAFFLEKYPDEVSVYTIGKDAAKDWISKEFCGGPHVNRTGEIGSIKLTKEQAVSSGVRRVYMELS